MDPNALSLAGDEPGREDVTGQELVDLLFIPEDIVIESDDSFFGRSERGDVNVVDPRRG